LRNIRVRSREPPQADAAVLAADSARVLDTRPAVWRLLSGEPGQSMRARSGSMRIAWLRELIVKESLQREEIAADSRLRTWPRTRPRRRGRICSPIRIVRRAGLKGYNSRFGGRGSVGASLKLLDVMDGARLGPSRNELSLGFVVEFVVHGYGSAAWCPGVGMGY